MSLSHRLGEYIAAAFTGIYIQSHEHADALAEIAHLCRDHKWALAVWDIDQGLQTGGQAAINAADPVAAIRSLTAMATPDGSALLVLLNFHRFLQSTEIVQALARQLQQGKTNRTFIIILSPIVQIPIELEKGFVVIEHDLPDRQQLQKIAEGIATEAEEMPRGEDLGRLLDAGSRAHESRGRIGLQPVGGPSCQAPARGGLGTQSRHAQEIRHALVAPRG